MAIFQAIREINRTYFKKSDVKLKMGEYSAWLEVHFNPYRQNNRSQSVQRPPMPNNQPPQNVVPQQPRPIPVQMNQRYANNANNNMEKVVNVMPVSQNQPSPRPVETSKVMNRQNTLDNSMRRSMSQNRPSNIMDDESSISGGSRSPQNSNFRRGSPSQFTPARSNLGGSSLSRSTPKRGMSAKQRRFYERLQKHKRRKDASPSPYRNNEGERGMEVHYDSQVPEQEKIFDPNKSINLMAQDPYI